ncbi:MAG: MerR family transcriptional regulator [Polyangiaceae bacterium]|nr:MerR family transcriptional regulator [Polyangiaceae bacterium]
MTYQIRTVSEITGIPRNTLIAWERRYGIVSPERHSNGYRDYSESDLNILLKVRGAIETGLKISEAVQLVKSEKAKVFTPEPTIAPAPTPLADADPSSALKELTEQLTDALTHFRRAEADEILLRVNHIPFDTKLRGLLFPVLRNIGDLWTQGKVSIAQEHYASGHIRSHLAAFQLSIGSPDDSAPKAVCAAVAGDLHDIPALALSIRLGLAGYQTAYFGADTPAEPLGQCIQTQLPQLVCISMVAPISGDRINQYIIELRRPAIEHCRYIIGGAGIPPYYIPPQGVELAPHFWDLQL